MTSIIKEPSSLIPLMVVSFDLAHSAKVGFDRFYNHEFLPQLFSLSPQLRAIKRYQKSGQINLQLDQKETVTFDDALGKNKPTATSGEYWTLYELDGQLTLDRTDGILGHLEFADILGQFRIIKDAALKDFRRVNYDQLTGYRREEEGHESQFGPLKPSFCAFLTFSVLPAEEDVFMDWYLATYQLEMFEQAPGLHSLRTYRVWKQDQCEILSVFESFDENGLVDALEQIRYKANSNPLWRDFLTDGTILGPRAILTRPIFALPQG